MSKLQVNDDGSVTIPLPGKTPVTIDTPALGDIGWLEAEAERLDALMPPLPAVGSEPPSPEDRELLAKANRERNAFAFGAEQGYPYAAVIAELVTRVTGEPCALADLPSWARAPATLGLLVATFRTP
jgi:hypothetical protein